MVRTGVITWKKKAIVKTIQNNVNETVIRWLLGFFLLPLPRILLFAKLY
jgi:hypothetical protein